RGRFGRLSGLSRRPEAFRLHHVRISPPTCEAATSRRLARALALSASRSARLFAPFVRRRAFAKSILSHAFGRSQSQAVWRILRPRSHKVGRIPLGLRPHRFSACRSYDLAAGFAASAVLKAGMHCTAFAVVGRLARIVPNNGRAAAGQTSLLGRTIAVPKLAVWAIGAFHVHGLII